MRDLRKHILRDPLSPNWSEQRCLQYEIKGGYAHFNIHIFHFSLIDLDLWNAFCEVSPWGSFLFALSKRKYVPLGMRLLWKYIRNYFRV